MLFTLGLLLLLTPFPTFQTPTNERRNSTGSDMTKPNAVFTLSKPKTTSTPAKQAIRPTLKPITVNQTLLPTPATNQKPPTVNATVATKSKVSPGVIQTAAVKIHTASGTIINKDKHTVAVNQTVLTKSPSGSEVKADKDKPVPTGASNVHSAPTKSASASSAKTTKDKLQPSVNQTISVKSPSTSDGKIAKDKPVPPIVQNVPSTSAKPAPAGGAATSKNKPVTSVNQTVIVKTPSTVGVKHSKDKPVASVNQTVVVKPASTVEVKTPKDKPVASVNQTVVVKPASNVELKNSKDKPVASLNQTVVVKPASTVEVKTPKNKPVASVNQTVVVKPLSTVDVKNPKDKPAADAVHTPLSTPAKAAAAAAASGSAADKVKVTSSPNQSTVIKAPINTNATKEKPAPSQPLKVVISDGCDSNKASERELKVKPGTPLVMTHKISLMPGGCDGRCETELAALIGRVARLEREMSQLKDNCPCSANCPNDCSGNGECEKGKCVCHQGFVGPDCSKCAQGTECNKKTTKGKAKETVEAVTLQKKDQKKENEAKESDGKPKVTTIAKLAPVKTQQAQQEVSVKKITTKSSPSVTKTSRPTVAQVLLKHEGKKQEEARKGKTVLAAKKVLQKTEVKIVKVGTASKMYPKPDQLKDEPQTNVTQANFKKFNVTAKIVTILSKGMGTNKTRAGKETLEQSTLADKNATQSSGPKRIKTIKVENVNVQSSVNRNNEAAMEKVTQRSQYVVNATLAATTDKTQNKTAIHGPGVIRRVGGSGLGSVKVVNISSYSFTLTWLAPQGMFKNFSVIRREPRTEGDEDDHEEFEEEPLGLDKASVAKNPAEVQVQTENTETATPSGKITGSRGKTETKRISMVVPGNVRSVEFSNLRANTRYSLYIYGTSAERRSKMHRVVAVTGPEPATEMVFSNVTESSLTVAWTKPKTMFTGYRVTYTNIITGERRFVVSDYQQSYIVLSKLSAGSSYIISVTTTQGQGQSDALMSIITTVPAPPTHLQVANVTDTKATLQWTPSLGKVDRFIVSYESSKTPNVTVTVMLSGNSVEHQLKGLQRGTLYRVKVLSQKDSLQSMAISTTFTTANVVKASEVGARSAVITWKTFTVVYHSYRVIYQVAGGETREVILDSTVTEYKLTGLLSTSRYIVLVQGERDGHYTSLVTTEFITGKLRFPFPTECSQELLNGALQSGEVDIYPQGKEGQAIRVYCDMETDGGGWTVFQRRMNGKTDFYRTWNEYRAGFGNLSEEFWLGNELLHNLTSIGPVSLRADMKSGNETAYAQYANFSIDSEGRHYSLTVSGYSGIAGDSMRYHNGRPFSTWDKDADPLGIHCARAYMGGWWYKNCYKTNLNGLYGINSNNQGVVWIDWKGKDSSIPFTEMKIRPSRFSPATLG